MSDLNIIDSSKTVKTKKKNNFLMKFSAVLCSIAVLGGIGYTVYFVDTHQKERLAVQNAAKELPMPDIPKPVLKLEDYDANRPVYKNERNFTFNESRLSKRNYRVLTRSITASYSVLYDVSADEIIFEENSDKKCYPASTTKLLTAIVASKIITDHQMIITVGNEIKLIGEESSSAGLKMGMKLTFETLMDAMMLPSGNDAAYTMAVTAARIYRNDPTIPSKEAVEIFVDLMNDATIQIGANNSHFVNPDGWHDKNHYTTAKDLAKISVYAKSIPVIANSCSTHYAERKLIKGGMIYWVNTNIMLNDYYACYSQYCDGLKTGYTDEAGSCVIASATMDDHTFIAVVMDGQNGYSKYDDANLMFRHGFKLYDLKYTYGPPKA